MDYLGEGVWTYHNCSLFGADKERKKKAGAAKIICGSRWRMVGNGRQ